MSDTTSPAPRPDPTWILLAITAVTLMALVAFCTGFERPL